MWELKEKSTNVEVKLQYTILKLEDHMNDMKSRLEILRKENCNLGDLIKNKYALVR